MSSTGKTPRPAVIVPVARQDVSITLDQVLDSLARQTASMAGSGGAQPPAPAVAERLQKIGQLAAEMKSVLGELATLDPAVHARLQGEDHASEH